MNAIPELERACAELDAMPDGAIEKPFRLRCPNCLRRSARAFGGRIYLCLNENCPGNTRDESPGRHALSLTVDSMFGARLLPWKEVGERDRLRVAHPLAVLRRLLPVYEYAAR